MKIQTARNIIATLWLLGSIPVFGLVVLQSYFQKFGSEPEFGFNWITPLLAPIVSLVLTVLSVIERNNNDERRVNKLVFALAIISSLAYLASFLLFLVLHPFADQSIQELMKASGLFFGLFQGFVTAIISKFLIDNA